MRKYTYTNLCVYTYLWIFLYVTIFIDTKLKMSSHGCLQLYYHMDHTSLPLMLLCNLLLRVRKLSPTIYINLANCSSPVYMYSGFKIINTYPHEEQLYQLEYSACVWFLLTLDLEILFLRLHRLTPFPLHYKCFIHL